VHETDFHSYARRTLYRTLQDHFAATPDVYVATRMTLSFDPSNPHRHRDPDGLVARGVSKHPPRRSYRIWEEKVVPCVLFEMASQGTWRVDLNEKRVLYASLGVKEYFLYDPEGCYLDPVLQGFRTRKGKPVALEPAADGSLVSKQLQMRLVPEGQMLRPIDLRTGQPLLTPGELAEQAKRARLEAQHSRLEVEQDVAEHRRARLEAEPRAAEHRRARLEARHARLAAEPRCEQLRAEIQRLQAALEKKMPTVRRSP
jgi:Uma2 family endonuclease